LGTIYNANGCSNWIFRQLPDHPIRLHPLRLINCMDRLSFFSHPVKTTISCQLFMRLIRNSRQFGDVDLVRSNSRNRSGSG